MAIQNLTKIYEGTDLSGAAADVIYLPILLAGTLTGVDVLTDEVTVGDVVFSLWLNGVEQAAAAATVTNGELIESVTGLSIAIVKGDEIILRRVSGSISSPVTLNLIIDDGISSGSTLPAGDLNVNDNTLEKIQGRNITVPATLTTIGDDFNDNSIDTVLFSVWADNFIGYTVTEINNQIEMATTTSNARIGGLKTNIPIDITDRYVQIKLSYLSGSNRMFCFLIFNGDPSIPANVIPYGGANKNSVGFGCGISSLSPESTGVFAVYKLESGALGFNSATAGLNTAGRYFKIRHSTANSSLYLETSTDGATWTVLHTYSFATLSGFDFTNIKVAILGGRPDSGGFDPVVGFDDFTSNITPPDPLTDKTLLWWNTANNRFEEVSLTDLKTDLEVQAVIPAGDLNLATNVINTIQDRDIYVPAPPAIFGDEFTGSSLDITKWVDLHSGSYAPIVGSGVCQLRAPNGGQQGMIKSLPSFNFIDGSFVEIEFSNPITCDAFMFGIFAPAHDIYTYSSTDWVGFQFVNNPNDNQMYVKNNGLYAYSGTPGGISGYIRKVRIKRIVDTIYVEVAGTGQAYVAITNFTTTLDLTNISVFANIFCSPAVGSIDVDYIHTNFSADALSNNSILIWSTVNARFQPISLVDLKAAINALP